MASDSKVQTKDVKDANCKNGSSFLAQSRLGHASGYGQYLFKPKDQVYYVTGGKLFHGEILFPILIHEVAHSDMGHSWLVALDGKDERESLAPFGLAANWRCEVRHGNMLVPWHYNVYRDEAEKGPSRVRQNYSKE